MIPQSGPFAIVSRAGRELVEIFQGDVVSVASLADIPLSGAAGPSTLALVPYRQVAERGFECVDDGAPLECLRIAATSEIALDDLLALLPADPPVLRDGAFDIDDDGYAALVGEVLSAEIGRGDVQPGKWVAATEQ